MRYLLPHIVDESAARHPDREAFRCAGASLMYADLAVRTDRLAYVLSDRGVRRGDRVGVYLRKSLETAVAVYGIMKAGAAYVPLDPGMPAARMEAVLRNAGIRHLVTHDALHLRLQDVDAKGVGLEHVVGLARPVEGSIAETVSWEEVEQAPAVAWRQQGRTTDDMAYLMYTSGSTGTPKGIVHTHASGLSYAAMAADVYGLRPHDRLSGFAPLHFDMSTFDYFSGPLAGATTVIIPEAFMMMPASLAGLIEDERLTVWYSVPYALINLLLRGALADRDLSSLRWVLFGGEPFPVKHLRALMRRWPHARFSNVYGPAEVNQCTFHHLEEPPEDDAAPVPIGPIWPNAEGLVLGDNDALVAVGEVGELVVRTPTMMQGYWSQPELNARAFYHRQGAGGIADTFYRTGDLVRHDAGGVLVFVGRKDRQVKTRGYRVELDEVEAALLMHPDVAEAATFAVTDADGTCGIQAAVRPRMGRAVDVDALLEQAAEHLPRYALPLAVAILDDFPRTTSGKVDRRALAAGPITSPTESIVH